MNPRALEDLRWDVRSGWVSSKAFRDEWKDYMRRNARARWSYQTEQQARRSYVPADRLEAAA